MIQALKKRYWDIRRTTLNSRASVDISRLNMTFLPWSSSAIQPASLMNILNEILINQRKTVIEFGCGISTLYIARILSEIGGHLISFEDHSEWAAEVRQMLSREALSETVSLVEAPLRDCSFSVNDLQWYDEKIVASALKGVRADLVLVDGPSAYEAGKGLARYPAFPATVTHLGSRCAIILDDIGRSGEQQVVYMWKQRVDFDFEVKIVPVPNIGIFYRGSHFNAMYT